MDAEVNTDHGHHLLFLLHHHQSSHHNPLALPTLLGQGRSAGTHQAGGEISSPEPAEVLHEPIPTSPSAEAGLEYLSVIRGTI